MAICHKVIPDLKHLLLLGNTKLQSSLKDQEFKNVVSHHLRLSEIQLSLGLNFWHFLNLFAGDRDTFCSVYHHVFFDSLSGAIQIRICKYGDSTFV